MQPKFQRPATCAGCPLHPHAGGFSYAVGPAKARLCLVGEALGGEEAIRGEPFQGAAGGVLSRVLQRVGIDRAQVRIANIVSCQPPGNWLEGAPWEHGAIAHCRQYLQPVLDALPDDAVVVPLGATALKALLGLGGQQGITVKDWHGTVQRDPTGRLWVVPTFHPSFLQRGAMNHLEVVCDDLRRAVAVSASGWAPAPAALVVDPPLEWFRQWVDQHLAALQRDPLTTWLALDTEFPEKAAGQDEGEIDANAASGSPIIRYNVSHQPDEGVTVPAHPAYAAEIERLLQGTGAANGWIWYWNKYADIDHLLDAGHTICGTGHLDLMWLVHYLQSDLPRGLGFWGPIASDFGAWKHWAKDPALFGRYAAADALQTYRIAAWAVAAARRIGLFDVWWTDWHERDLYVLRPSREMGVPMDRPALEAFHQELQQKHARVLKQIEQIGAQGSLRPKQGYAKRPKPGADGVVRPPKSILGQQKGKRRNEAKQEYLAEGVVLVERACTVDLLVCGACQRAGVGAKHNCLPRPKARARDAAGPAPTRAVPPLRSEPCRVTRWFWQVPFNPSSWQQILSYIQQQGHKPGTHRKTKAPTTDKESLKKLAAQTGDPLYQLLLDGRAIEKVDGTYAVGTLVRLDSDNRVHPEITPKPSTLRDSSSGPNLQNVVADKAKQPGLASGFRRCVQARDGVPGEVSAEELQQWQQRWGLA